MKISETLAKQIHSALNNLGISEIAEKDILLEHPADQSHGDYSTNVAMVLFGRLKKNGSNNFKYNSPRELAQAIANELKKKLDSSLKDISKIEIAGSGFINFTLSDAFLIAKMGLTVQKCGDVVEKVGSGKKIVAEYSSPNIAKPFTVGHLRSTIIGDSLANIFESLGYEVYRDNHLGDWGTQFGKQIYAIKTWGDESQIENSENPVKELVELYVKFHLEAEKDPEIIDRGREWFSKLENGDREAKRLWDKCIAWSWKEFEKIYQKLGVSFTENGGKGYGESYFEDKMDEVVDELKEKGLLKESEGAQLVFFPDEKFPPMMIIKKDGSTLYSTRDLATDKFRLKQYGSDPSTVIFNEVGSEQSLYFKQLYELEQMLGWYQRGQRVHVGHGLIRFKDKKMSTRKGNVIWLEDVLNEAYKRAENASKNLSSDEIWKIAIGALKWNDLKRNYRLPMVFDWDELTNIKGNSGPYIQYTYVRCRGVLEKSLGSATEDIITEHFDTLVNLKAYLNHQPNEQESDILRNLYKYYEIVKSAGDDYAPHYIASYLYELAQSFNTFYGMHKVVDDANDKETTEFRMIMVQAVACVLKHGLELLGIEVIEWM